jgi:hypothetical protein
MLNNPRQPNVLKRKFHGHIHLTKITQLQPKYTEAFTIIDKQHAFADKLHGNTCNQPVLTYRRTLLAISYALYALTCYKAPIIFTDDEALYFSIII